MLDERSVRESVASTAQMMARAGLAEAFGHVSVRWGDGFAITSTLPFSLAGPDDVLIVASCADPVVNGEGVPLETPMHASIYSARSDVGAICRGHPQAVVAWGVGTTDLPLLHGLGALAGEHVAVHPDVDLVSTIEKGSEVADALAGDSCLILRGNGCLAVGATALEAITRLYHLEERARVALGGDVGEEAVWADRLRHTDAELPRAMAWMAATFASSESSPGSPPDR